MMRPPESYSQPDAPDPVLDAATVLRLVRRHRPSAREMVAVDETGGEARVYAIDDDVILKTQRPHRLRRRTSLEKEVFFLGQLAVDPGIVVPRVYGYGREGAIEYTCMSRVPGVAIRYANLDPAQRRAALLALGRTLRRVHALEQAPFLASPLMPGDRSRNELVARVHVQLELAGAAIQSWPGTWPLPTPFEAVAALLLSVLPDHVELRALHSNPGPPHAFVHPTTGEYSGLIDFGDAYLSHAAFDLRTWPLRDDRRTLLEGYSADAAVTDDWLRVWHVVMVLAELAVLITTPAAAPDSVAALQELLERLP